MRLMITITIEELERNFAHYMKRVSEGETLLVETAGEPVAEIRPVERRINNPRPFGLAAGAFTVPDDFNAPLPEGWASLPESHNPHAVRLSELLAGVTRENLHGEWDTGSALAREMW
jgi:prevent-host-death family protein